MNHIAFIMDGNGRWANKQGKSRQEGHKAGFDNLVADPQRMQSARPYKVRRVMPSQQRTGNVRKRKWIS
jgi:undecaprenyl diphosphate synthase